MLLGLLQWGADLTIRGHPWLTNLGKTSIKSETLRRLLAICNPSFDGLNGCLKLIAILSQFALRVEPMSLQKTQEVLERVLPQARLPCAPLTCYWACSNGVVSGDRRLILRNLPTMFSASRPFLKSSLHCQVSQQNIVVDHEHFIGLFDIPISWRPNETIS